MYEYEAVVRSVHDGDSLRCDISLGFGIWRSDEALRLYGLDAPELGTDEGRAARDYLRQLLPVGTRVLIRTHRDQAEKYGRMLAQITVAMQNMNLDVNQQMIDTGHAHAYDGGKR